MVSVILVLPLDHVNLLRSMLLRRLNYGRRRFVPYPTLPRYIHIVLTLLSRMVSFTSEIFDPNSQVHW